MRFSPHLLTFPALNHVAEIHFVPQNAVDGRIAPVGNAVRMVGISVMLAVCVFIGGRAEDAFFV
jgi:hypothetical protein